MTLPGILCSTMALLLLVGTAVGGQSPPFLPGFQFHEFSPRHLE